MKRRNGIFILLILLSAMIRIPSARAGGSVDAEDVIVSFNLPVWTYPWNSSGESSGFTDGWDSTEEYYQISFIAFPLDDGVEWQWNVTEVAYELYRSAGYSFDLETVIYEVAGVSDVGVLYGSENKYYLNYPGPGWVSQVMDPDVVVPLGEFGVYVGLAADDDQSGYHGINYELQSQSYGSFNRTPFGFPDPMTGETRRDDRAYAFRIKLVAIQTKSTNYNQYFGDTENYVARRDVNTTFPPGADTKKYQITLSNDEALINISYSNGGLWDETLSESDYSVSVYNGTHDVITILNTPLSLYGADLRIFSQSYNYVYNLYGPYFENGTNSGSKTVTATRADASEEIELDGQYLYAHDDSTTLFTYVVSGGETRRYYPVPPNEDIYIFDPDGAYATYGFDIRDYPGIVGTNVCFLEAIRSVNGTDRVVERNIIWNTHSTVPLILVKNKVYLLRVRLEDGSYYTFGYFTPGDYTPPTLSILGLGFSDYYQPVSQWVQMEITRPNSTHIQLSYDDDLELTVNVEVKIEYRNGTEVYTDSEIANECVFNWYGANNETEYVAYITANHGLYGEIKHSRTLSGLSSPPGPPDFTPLGIPIAGVSIFLILAVGTSVSKHDGPAGLFAASCIAGVLTSMNWIAIPYELIGIALALSIVFALGGR